MNIQEVNEHQRFALICSVTNVVRIKTIFTSYVALQTTAEHLKSRKFGLQRHTHIDPRCIHRFYQMPDILRPATHFWLESASHTDQLKTPIL